MPDGPFPYDRKSRPAVRTAAAGAGRGGRSHFVEDAGLLQGILAFGHVPHPHRPICATSGQKSFFTAPTASDNLQRKNKGADPRENEGGPATASVMLRISSTLLLEASSYSA